MASSRSAQVVRAVTAVLVGGVAHVGAILIYERSEPTAEILTTILWVVLVVWALALVTVVMAVVKSGRGMFLLGGEAWLRLGVAALAAAVGGGVGLWAGNALQEWTLTLSDACQADGLLACPSELLYLATPALVIVALAGLAWTIAASRR